MRNNLFDSIASLPTDLYADYNRINKLFAKKYYAEVNDCLVTIEDYIDKRLFRLWQHRGRFISIFDLRTSLGIDDESLNNNISLDSFLLYVEYVINMIAFCRKHIKLTDPLILLIIRQNIKNVLDRLNFCSVEIDDRHIIIAKDSPTTRVADIRQDISEEIIEYKRFIYEGNIEKKASILRNLWKAYEPIDKKLDEKHNLLTSNIRFILNNLDVRHNSSEGPKANKVVQEMSIKELEMWYDRAYDALLIAFMLNDYYEIENEFTELRKQFKEQK